MTLRTFMRWIFCACMMGVMYLRRIPWNLALGASPHTIWLENAMLRSDAGIAFSQVILKSNVSRRMWACDGAYCLEAYCEAHVGCFHSHRWTHTISHKRCIFFFWRWRHPFSHLSGENPNSLHPTIAYLRRLALHLLFKPPLQWLTS